nr:hypothetical transcript [Hymenolepis microstoma]
MYTSSMHIKVDPSQELETIAMEFDISHGDITLQENGQTRLCRLRTYASSFSSRVFIVELSSSAPRQGTDVKMPPLRKSRHAMSAVFACCVSVVVA